MATSTRNPRGGDAGAPRILRAAGRRGRAPSKTKSPKTQVEAPGELTWAVSAIRVVYDGRQCLGHLLLRGKLGVEAFDRNDVSLGIYPDQRSAADAVSEAAS
jgi:hypothetical protein